MATRLGNLFSEEYGTGFSYNVWDINDTAPTIRTFCGGGQQPYIIEKQIQAFENMETVKIKQATKQGYIECEVGGVADLSFPDSKTRRGRVVDNGNTCPTIQCENDICKIEKVGQISSDGSQYGTVLSEEGLSGTQSAGTHGYANNCIQQKYRIRKLTPRECFRLMDFDDTDYDAAEEVNTNTQLYKQAGNSIVVSVLENIFKVMIDQGDKQ